MQNDGWCCVNALSGLYLISTVDTASVRYELNPVSMPSRAYTSFLPKYSSELEDKDLPVSMPSRAYTSFLQLSEFEKETIEFFGVNALSGLYLISTRIESLWSTLANLVSMPSRAYTSFLRYPFKNLGFMRFPEPVFAGIYQNILTTAVFRAC